MDINWIHVVIVVVVMFNLFFSGWVLGTGDTKPSGVLISLFVGILIVPAALLMSPFKRLFKPLHLKDWWGFYFGNKFKTLTDKEWTITESMYKRAKTGVRNCTPFDNKMAVKFITKIYEKHNKELPKVEK